MRIMLVRLNSVLSAMKELHILVLVKSLIPMIRFRNFLFISPLPAMR